MLKKLQKFDRQRGSPYEGISKLAKGRVVREGVSVRTHQMNSKTKIVPPEVFFFIRGGLLLRGGDYILYSI